MDAERPEEVAERPDGGGFIRIRAEGEVVPASHEVPRAFFQGMESSPGDGI